MPEHESDLLAFETDQLSLVTNEDQQTENLQ